jgi:hypothetical protein
MGDSVDEALLWRRQQLKISSQKSRDKKKATEIQQKKLLAELLKRNEEHVVAAKLNAEETRKLAADKEQTDKQMRALQQELAEKTGLLVSTT